MAVLQMLTEVIGTEELLVLVTLAELMLLQQVIRPRRPCWRIREQLSAIAACVVAIHNLGTGVRKWTRVEGVGHRGKSGARPTVTPEV